MKTTYVKTSNTSSVIRLASIVRFVHFKSYVLFSMNGIRVLRSHFFLQMRFYPGFFSFSVLKSRKAFVISFAFSTICFQSILSISLASLLSLFLFLTTLPPSPLFLCFACSLCLFLVPLAH